MILHLVTGLSDRSSLTRPFLLCADPSEKHAFRFLEDGRVAERPLNDPGPEPPDLVVFQAGQNLQFTHAATELPDHLWTSARDGRGRVVFDASPEGKAHEPGRSEQLHDMLRRVGVPLEQAVYLTQDRQYASDYSEYCQRIGLERRMRVIVHDYWIRRVLREFELSGPEALQGRLEGFRARTTKRPRRYLSLNSTPRPARLMLLTRLMQGGLWDLGFVSFGGFERMEADKGSSFGKYLHDFVRLPGFEDLAWELRPYLYELARRGRLVLSDAPIVPTHKDLVRPRCMPEYGESWFSIITETEMLDRPSRITEKVLKPLLNLHPLVLFGNPGSLKLIRGLGFVTFPQLIDESYDEELEPARRFELAFAEVTRLCRLDEGELARLSGALAEALEFNATWGLTRLPRKYADEYDEALLNDVLAKA